MQKILTIATTRKDLRAPVDSWGAESGDLIVPHKEIGYSDELKTPRYATVMHAIADGWKLLAPPVKEIDLITTYVWWLAKE